MKKTTHLLTLFVWSIGSTFAQLTPTYDDVLIPMSDGKSLSADVYIPSGCTNCEAVLIQTPYNKEVFETSGLPLGIGPNLNSQPFIWVIVDWRGFYASANAATGVTTIDRGQDGYDVCTWIAAQTWHGSKIGTWGASALGVIQYQLINKKHPNHTCAVPLVSDGQTAYDGYYTGGVLEKARLEQLDFLGYGLSPTILANPYYSNMWIGAEANTEYSDDIQIPTLQIGGWYDHNIDRMMRFYKKSRANAAANVKDKQWLLVGPWVHGGTGLAFVGSSTQGQLSYPNAAQKNNVMAMDFFKFYLLGTANNWEATPKITYYETGLDTWKTSNGDDITNPNTTQLFLGASKSLSLTGSTGSTTFTADPTNPVPTIGGATLNNNLQQGPYDQSSLDSRNDVITFNTGNLTSNMSISGKVKVQLKISANQPDCDIAIRMVDTYPDGRDMLITDGIKRVRFRNGFTKNDEVFMTSGQIYPVEIEMPFTNYTWVAGHQIKIYVSASHSTRFDVNLQNGGAMYTSGTANTAAITVYHDATNASKVLLPGANSLGLDEVSATPLIVYPNPASDFIQLDGAGNFASYELIDALGRTVQAATLTSDKIDISSLQTGVYQLVVKDVDGDMKRSVVVKE